MKNSTDHAEILEDIVAVESVDQAAAEPKVIDPLVRVQAEKAISQHLLGAMGLGVLPIPVVDFVGVTAVQLKLVSKLSKIYGVEFSMRDARTIISTLIGGAVPLMAAMPVASIARMIPVVGWSVGSVAMPILAGASTYAVGHLFMDHFEKGAGPLDINTASVKEKFAEYYEAGKAKVTRKKTAAEPTVETAV
jgi:uncharacterized protein (DUF697 family)